MAGQFKQEFLIWPRWSQVRTPHPRPRRRRHLSNAEAVRPKQPPPPPGRPKKELRRAEQAEEGKGRPTPTHQQTRSTAKCQSKRARKGQRDRLTCKGKENLDCANFRARAFCFKRLLVQTLYSPVAFHTCFIFRSLTKWKCGETAVGTVHLSLSRSDTNATNISVAGDQNVLYLSKLYIFWLICGIFA